MIRDVPPRPASRLPAEISGLDIVVATEHDAAGDTLTRELQRTRGRVRHVWPVPDLLPQDVDLIFCDPLPDLPARLPWVPGEPKAALVLLIPPDGPLDLDLVRKAAPEAVLHRPFTPSAILASLLLARTRFAYERRLRGRIQRLDGTLRLIRTVERAKTILMNARNIEEDSAYEYLRTQAMSRRVPVGAIAEAIVDAHDLLG